MRECFLKESSSLFFIIEKRYLSVQVESTSPCESLKTQQDITIQYFWYQLSTIGVDSPEIYRKKLHRNLLTVQYFKIMSVSSHSLTLFDISILCRFQSNHAPRQHTHHTSDHHLRPSDFQIPLLLALQKLLSGLLTIAHYYRLTL